MTMSTPMTTITDKIRDYINDSFLTDSDVTTVGLDEDLLTVLDSLQILRLVMDLESFYSIKVENSDLTPDNLGTVEKLSAFIERKRQESCSTAAP